MTGEPPKCPICLNKDGSSCKHCYEGSKSTFTCEICGNFEITFTALGMLENNNVAEDDIGRAALSYYVRQSFEKSSKLPSINSNDIRKLVAKDLFLPTPAKQASNIIRHVGSCVSKTGENLENFPISFYSSVGSPTRNAAMRLVLELITKGILTGIDASSSESVDAIDVNLTLEGWEIFEADKKGKKPGSFGFLAMKFGDEILDPFANDVIKPAIQSMSYELLDLRDTAEAGVIDNLLRMQIRDAAFVLVDLTHDNSGAYWEAGYAEGLGKPVLYLCEKKKFDEKQTHFDTNHCTTVTWDTGDPDKFSEELVATLRRSLNEH